MTLTDIVVVMPQIELSGKLRLHEISQRACRTRMSVCYISFAYVCRLGWRH